MDGSAERLENSDFDINVWKSRTKYLSKIGKESDGLVYILQNDPDDHWTVSFVDGTLPIPHPYHTENVGGRRIEDIIPRSVFNIIRPVLKAAFQGTEGSYEVEYTPGMWLLGRVKPFEVDADGRVLQIISTNGDVTLQKIAEREREQQRERLEALVRALPDLIFVFDRNGVFLGYNTGVSHDLLVSPSQFIGASLEDILPADVAAEARRVLEVVALTSGSGELKYSLMLNGQTEYFHARMVPLGEEQILAVARNITDLVTARRDEELVSAQLEVASKVAGLAYWSWDVERREMRWSPEVFAMLGIERAEPPTLEELYSLLNPDVVSRVRAVAFETIETSEMRQIEFSIDRGNRDVRHFLTSMEISRDTLSNKGILHGAIQEITEVRRLEAQLLQSQKMESIGRFAGMMAHDFNNMLQVIRGYAEVLGGAVADQPKQSAYVGSILEAADKAGALVKRILGFSRQSDMVVLEMPIDQVIRELAGMIGPLMGTHVQFEIRTGCGSTTCNLDKSGFEQAVVNLAVNARDAMPEGGKLLVETSLLPRGLESVESRMAWPWLTERDYVTIDISDTGTGIPEDIVERIFEPFYTTKPAEEGTGLGLSTSYSIIRRHEGVLYVKDTGSGGTRFRILLPVVTPDQTSNVQKSRRAG
ncbi:MAG TPA: ATP-binding protein [Myxococcota bacterium]|nr:ATP-binding protein [Myxococcota bacterium]